jgi:hypothetical protein
LEDSVAQVLQGQFGIFAVGKKDEVQIEPEARMSHLSEEDRAYRQDLLDHFEHIKALGYKAKDALAQLIREVAFTHLNRFCAYRMMESRGLIRESVSKGLKSQGFLFYLADHEEDERRFNTGQQDVAYRHFLNWLGGTLSEEIGVLFAPTDPANRLYPPQRVIDEVLGLLNDPELAGIWSEDEAIGWVYQYFTPKELRDQARKESQAPRNSYELAFRNQFFTPRYVVEFLTDNTLGRIWYEMRHGETRLKDQCRYMVRRPTEVFLKEGEKEPDKVATATDDLSQEELLKLPVYVPFRAKKDPRELRILDPACGSGHFLLYCFDLLLTIYEEAYGDPDLSPALKKDYPTLEDLRRHVPRLVLAHNLHGIDIDPRASQIAALALWLRCQRAYQEMGIKQDRPKITRSNIVCAEPMPGEAAMLKEFVNHLEPKVLGQVVEVVFENMKLAGEAGSLLKIEEEIRDAVAAAKKQYARETTQATDRKGRAMLFSEAEMERLADGPKQSSLFDVSDITDSDFFEEAERRVIDALRSYSEQAQRGQQLRRRLFSEDAAQGFAFVDLCQHTYDVVLMNPPFGEVSLAARDNLYVSLPESSRDIIAAFVTRWTGMLSRQGRLGALTNRMVFFNEFLGDWRKKAFLGDLGAIAAVADLGYGVLDAVVETAAYVTERAKARPCVFIRLLADAEKQSSLLSLLRCMAIGDIRLGPVAFHDPRRFASLPATRFAYDIGHRWLDLLRHKKSHSLIAGRGGICTGDDFRFYRLFWEISEEASATSNWRWLAKGGEFSRYYCDTHLKIDWTHKPLLLRTKNSDRYGERGATYTYRTTSNLSARILNDGVCFSQGGPAILPHRKGDAPFVLALMNSFAATYCLEAIVGGGDSSVRGSAARNLEPRYLEFMPDITPSTSELLWFEKVVAQLHNSLAALDQCETDALFFGTDLSGSTSLQSYARSVLSRAADALRLAYQQVQLLEEKIQELLGLDATGVAETYPITGWPWPTSTDTSAVPAELLRALDVVPRDLPRLEISDRNIEHRFANKLSHYLHADIEGLSHAYSVHPVAILDAVRKDVPISARFLKETAHGVLSLALGGIFGRWNVAAITTANSGLSPDPFESLPQFQPAALLGGDGRPLKAAPEGYPLQVSWEGVVSDDPQHPFELLGQVRAFLATVWQGDRDRLEDDLAAALSAKDLREYFRKPGKGGFWDDHISRYSKSRRKAPIYWLLQSSKKNYAIWLYYHRLDKDILFKALVNYVEPKVRLETDRLESLRAQKGEGGKASKKLDKEIEKQEEFMSELRDFEEKLRRAAELRLVPDLNDGVVLNIAPLHELVPWKEAENYWTELLEGQYEWSSIGKQLREKGLVK